jgi:hypothetical protein
MYSVIHDGAASALATWPLVLLALMIGWLVGTAFIRAGRTSPSVTRTQSGPNLTCQSAGHHYLKDTTRWSCSHCGDEIRHVGHDAHSHSSREAVGV